MTKKPEREDTTPISDFTDKWGCCKICGGEIPYGHVYECYIYTKEREFNVLRDELDAVFENTEDI